MVTVRGQARPRDGRIHTDSRTKLVTVLLYMNPGWSDGGGWLRLLRSSDSLDDYFAEVPPEAGTAVFFRCTKNAWHGHTPFVGPRRAIQLNWVLDESVVRREQGRHRISARLKKYFP
jgi:Rps23 Pro-64 3,4-dihydroxylase Tpa1-like proline 4-hydroxylase